MRLPQGERAVIDIAKLRGYCLNPTHPRGRHKARLFAAVLGLNLTDAEFLRDELLRAARDGEAAIGHADHHGERYTIDSDLKRGDRGAIVRSCWIVRRGEKLPRLTSCYVLLS